MAGVEDGQNTKGMRDAKVEAYYRNGRMLIDGEAARDMDNARRVELANDVRYPRDVVRRRRYIVNRGAI